MFESAMNVFTNLSTTYKLIGAVILLVSVYFAYTMYQKRTTSVAMPVRTEEFGGQGGETVTCTMYYTDWCKFCKKAKPDWEQLTQEYHNQEINGKKILVTKVNCDEEKELAEAEDIKGYPTFKFKIDGQEVDYPDEPVFDKFKTFVEYLVGA